MPAYCDERVVSVFIVRGACPTDRGGDDDGDADDDASPSMSLFREVKILSRQ